MLLLLIVTDALLHAATAPHSLARLLLKLQLSIANCTQQEQCVSPTKGVKPPSCSQHHEPCRLELQQQEFVQHANCNAANAQHLPVHVIMPHRIPAYHKPTCACTFACTAPPFISAVLESNTDDVTTTVLRSSATNAPPYEALLLTNVLPFTARLQLSAA
jgi:hypothetical protein